MRHEHDQRCGGCHAIRHMQSAPSHVRALATSVTGSDVIAWRAPSRRHRTRRRSRSPTCRRDLPLQLLRGGRRRSPPTARPWPFRVRCLRPVRRRCNTIRIAEIITALEATSGQTVPWPSSRECRRCIAHGCWSAVATPSTARPRQTGSRRPPGVTATFYSWGAGTPSSPWGLLANTTRPTFALTRRQRDLRRAESRAWAPERL